MVESCCIGLADLWKISVFVMQTCYTELCKNNKGSMSQVQSVASAYFSLPWWYFSLHLIRIHSGIRLQLRAHGMWQPVYLLYCYIIICLLCQELPGGYGRVKPDIVTYGSSVRGSALQCVLHALVTFLIFFIHSKSVCKFYEYYC